MTERGRRRPAPPRPTNAFDGPTGKAYGTAADAPLTDGPELGDRTREKRPSTVDRNRSLVFRDR